MISVLGMRMALVVVVLSASCISSGDEVVKEASEKLDRVVHYMGKWGLQPTKAISDIIVGMPVLSDAQIVELARSRPVDANITSLAYYRPFMLYVMRLYDYDLGEPSVKAFFDKGVFSWICPATMDVVDARGSWPWRASANKAELLPFAIPKSLGGRIVTMESFWTDFKKLKLKRKLGTTSKSG